MKNGMRQPQSAAASGRHRVGDREAEQRREHDRDLLARRLPADIEALVSGRRHLRQIDRDAAELDAGREPLQQPAEHHQHRREHADRRIARHEGDEDRAAGHDRQRDDEAFAPADAIDVGAEHQRADRAHRKSRGETQERRHQRGVRIVAREEGVRNLPGVDAEQEEVVHLEEVAAGDAQNGLDLLQASLGHVGFSSVGAATVRFSPLPEGATVRALPPPAQWPDCGQLRPTRSLAYPRAAAWLAHAERSFARRIVPVGRP